MNGKQLTTNEFIDRAKEIHGDLYDYSLVEYRGIHSKVKIGCRQHGIFEQAAKSHISASQKTNRPNGCPHCAKEISRNVNKLSTTEFIEKAKQVHNDRYDYSKVIYINNYTSVEIVCPIHGSFFQLPWAHTSNGHECNKCSNSRKGLKGSRFPNKDTHLYLVEMFSEGEKFLKVGTTTRQVETRLKTHIHPYQFRVLQVRTLKGKDAAKQEQDILKQYSNEMYTPRFKFGGHTECFKYSQDNIERIKVCLVS